jgi:hypothetical protein
MFMTPKIATYGKNGSTPCGNKGTAILIRPYVPSFGKMPESTTFVLVGLETYTSKSQLWKGTAGTFMRSPSRIGTAIATWAARESVPPASVNVTIENSGPESIPRARKPASIVVLPKKV